MAMTIEPEQTQASGPRAIPVDSFGNRLMLARAHAGHISIREAAELCDIGRGAWTNWERGARPVDIIDIATVVADKLGVDRDWLLFGGNLARHEGRPVRRGRDRPRTTHGYQMISVSDENPNRPRDNRPPSRPDSTTPGRTSYLSRAGRGGRGR